jgi:hypothetical protein
MMEMFGALPRLAFLHSQSAAESMLEKDSMT